MFWKPKFKPFINYLPEPPDAQINLLRYMIEQRYHLSSIDIDSSHIESPSARLAIELYQLEVYGQKNLEVRVANVQTPDPRIPHRPVEFVLWTYRDTDPEPAYPPPDPEVAQAVGKIAATPYDLGSWLDQAQNLARQLNTGDVPNLLGSMIYPPKRPAKFRIWNWLYGVQVAASFTMACIDTGWERSIRRPTLISLAYGPMDWTVDAALLGLQQIARLEPASQEELGLLYIDLLKLLPTEGGVRYADALNWCIKDILPLLPAHLASELELRARAWGE